MRKSPSPPIILATIDGDPGASSWIPPVTDEEWRRWKKYYECAVKVLFDIFDTAGLIGKITWFLNEVDVRWTHNFPYLLDAILERGDTVGLHSHFGGIFGRPIVSTFKDVLAVCKAGKEELEAYLGGRKIKLHRSGCFRQTATIYEVLKTLGFNVVSDVNPGRKTLDAEGHILDNSTIPLSAVPWRHDVSNWLDYRSTEGWFLHIPVTAEGIDAMTKLTERVIKHNIHIVC